MKIFKVRIKNYEDKKYVTRRKSFEILGLYVFINKKLKDIIFLRGDLMMKLIDFNLWIGIL